MTLRYDKKVSTFCSIATFSAVNDLYSLILSLSYTNPGSKLYIISDTATKEEISSLPIIGDIELFWRIELDAFTSKNRKMMEEEGTFAEFLMTKTRAIEFALEYEDSVMYLDSHIFVMSEIKLENYQGQNVSLSKHHIKSADENLYGVFNAGVVWTNSLEVPELWRQNLEGSRWDDQAALEGVAAEMPIHIMHQGQNFSWWRLVQGNDSTENLVRQIRLEANGKLSYKGNIIQFINVHLKTNSSVENEFTKIILKSLAQSRSIRLLILLLRGMHGNWPVTLPPNERSNTFFNHKGDSFREHVQLWEERGFCKIFIENTNNCWFGPKGGCLLYDWDNHNWMDDEAQNSILKLFGNAPPVGENSRPWIFWARHPKILENFVNSRLHMRDFNKRTTESVFIGNIENSVQQEYRSDNWGSVIEDFILTKSSTHLLSQNEYLNRISQSKFGLSLRGFGPKCNRDIELLALGTVPVVTPDCDVDNYAEPLIEGIHYLTATSPKHFKEVVSSISEERWSILSNAGRNWWQRNSSARGSFEQTLRVIFQ